MKIAFVTSGLEPGCDGVGDYSTTLAEECEKGGHEILRIALNDRLIERTFTSEKLLRLPSSLNWNERAETARARLEKFAPDWISFHFVCYGFHPRGLVGPVVPHLKRIFAGWPIEVYFHELWIGGGRKASLKDRLFGWFQRKGVLRMMTLLDVRLVHTSNPMYVATLARNGIKANVLPLFGALPLPIKEEQTESGNPESTLTFVFFGTLHPVWPPEPLLTHLRSLNTPIRFVHTGRIGAGSDLWADMEHKYAGIFQFEKLGELPPQQIADTFAKADFGIATTPWGIIGKSASAAAMLDAGLPVVVNRDDVECDPSVEAGTEDPLLIRMDHNFPVRLRSIQRRAPRLRCSEVTKQFLKDWESSP